MSFKNHARQAELIVSAMRRHPKIVYQTICSGETPLRLLQESLPFFLPFGGASYHGVLPVLDWDHKIPSELVLLRLYWYYSEETLRAGQAEFKERHDQIAGLDVFPEFDVPDLAGVTADEIYDVEVDPTGYVRQVHLTSGWRRDIGVSDANLSVQLARRSEEYRKLCAEISHRQHHLGDLEAVNWTPPCESNYQGWTIDVWYLIELNGTVGKGRSFLVDLEKKKVVSTREFVVRSY